MNTENRGWVGDPNERAPFRFHGAVVGLVDRCLSRTRNLAASNYHLVAFFSGRSRPKICPGTIFFGFFENLETIFRRFVLIASGTYIFWREPLKFEIFSGNWQHRVSIVTGLGTTDLLKHSPPPPPLSFFLIAAAPAYLQPNYFLNTCSFDFFFASTRFHWHGLSRATYVCELCLLLYTYNSTGT